MLITEGASSLDEDLSYWQYDYNSSENKAMEPAFSALE